MTDPVIGDVIRTRPPTIVVLEHRAIKFADHTQLTTPRSDAALLTLIVDNVAPPGSENNTAKAVVTGVTFFLVASNVSDAYVCTARYQGPGASTPVTTTAHHLLHGRIGAVGAGPPANSIPVENAEVAIQMVLRQMLSHVLDSLSRHAAFPRGKSDEAVANPS